MYHGYVRYEPGVYVQFVGILNILQIFMLIPNYRRFFLSSEFNGYIIRGGNSLKKEPEIFLSFWISLSLLLVIGEIEMFASPILTIVAYYYFIRLRFVSINRGMGAPGYFTWLTNKNCTLILITENINNGLMPILLKYILIEAGLIFFISGMYKRKSGYSSGRGINVGLVNPQWSYAPKFWKKIKLDSPIFFLLNLLSIWGEIIGAVLLILPGLDKPGSLILILMFFAVAFWVRLGILCLQIILILSVSFMSTGTDEKNSNLILGTTIETTYILFFTILILLQLLAYYVNYNSLINLKKYDSNFQTITHLMNKYYGVSLWRVFTSDITSIYINIYSSGDNKNYKLLSKWESHNCFRFRNVGESITVTSLFTTLKYFPLDKELFNKKIITYSNSIEQSRFIKYKVHYISNSNNYSKKIFVSEFLVDKNKKKVIETILDTQVDLRAADIYSSVRPNSGNSFKGF